MNGLRHCVGDELQPGPEDVPEIVQRCCDNDGQQADQKPVFDRRGAGPVFDKALEGGDHSVIFLNAMASEALASTVEEKIS